MPGPGLSLLARELRRALDDRADAATRAKVERLVPGARVLGVSVPVVRGIALEFKRAHPELTPERAAELLDHFAVRPCREEMLAGVFLLASFGKRVATIPWRRVAPWIRRLDNWEVCDQLASRVVATIVYADPTCIEGLTRLTGSPNPWVRRFALATAADLSHAGRGMVDPAYEICLRLLDDPDPMIQTSIGWALREASKADPDATTAFLRKVAGRMLPRTLRDAAAKLPKGAVTQQVNPPARRR